MILCSVLLNKYSYVCLCKHIVKLSYEFDKFTNDLMQRGLFLCTSEIYIFGVQYSQVLRLHCSNMANMFNIHLYKV